MPSHFSINNDLIIKFSHFLTCRSMRQNQTVITPLSITIALLIFGVIGIRFWQHGGLMFNPGDLTSKSRSTVQLAGFQSHADFEDQCSLCHKPLTSYQGGLCLNCHTNIDTEILTPGGLHGQFPEVIRCQSCHSDHQGREFDPTVSARNNLNHELTGFSLTLHAELAPGQPIGCSDCHDLENEFEFQIEQCQRCHSQIDLAFMNEHIQSFTSSCLDCHDGLDRMSNFDHATLDFTLEGKHASVKCAACHQDKVFNGLPKDCQSCHAEPAAHKGLFGTHCQDCHSPEGWSPAVINGAVFNHDVHTAFALVKHATDFDGNQIECLDCHSSPEGTDIQQTCLSCHNNGNPAQTETHITQVGVSCLECHDGLDRMSSFDHNSVFLLTNSHAGLACFSCHEAGAFQSTPSNCSACHGEPTIHAGFFGLNCEYCHTTVAWAPAELKNHRFPLDHGSDAQLTCVTCHTTTYTEYSCYGCHEHNPTEIETEHLEEGVSINELADCAVCHPSGREEDE